MLAGCATEAYAFCANANQFLDKLDSDSKLLNAFLTDC